MSVPQLRFKGFSDGWSNRKVFEILQKVSRPVDVELSQQYRQIGIRSHGKGIFHKVPVTGASLGEKRIFWVDENLFVLNIVFAWEQAVAMTTTTEKGMVASHRFPMYKPRPNQSVTDYILRFFLTDKGKHYLGLASPGGAGRNKTLGQKNFEELNLIVPCVAEQTKIATFLTSVDEKISQLTQKSELLTQYKKGVMQQIFSQALRFKDDKGQDFPEWEETSISELGKSFTGLTGKSGDDFGEGKPYITYKQIFDHSKIDVSKFSYVQIGEKENQNQVKFGDVFFTTSSETPEEVGTCSALLTTVKETYLNSFCFGYRINSFDRLNPNFARFAFQSANFRRDVIKLAQGSTRYNISKTNFMKIRIQLPHINEQTKIANFLTAIDDKINNSQAQLKAAKQYKQGLLQQMFV